MYNDDALERFIRQKRQEDNFRRQTEAYNKSYYSSPFSRWNQFNYNINPLPVNDLYLQYIKKLNIDISSKTKAINNVSNLTSTLDNVKLRYSSLYYTNEKNAENWLQKRYPNYLPDESSKFLSIIVNEAVKQLIAYFIKKQLTQEEAANFDTCLNIFETFNSVNAILSQNKVRLDKCAAIAKLVQITTKYLK